MTQDTSRMRLTVVNLLVFTLLLTLVARLWYVQVLEQDTFRELATQTSVRLIYEQAPRGFVFDRHGEAMARNRTALTVAFDISRLPPDQQDTVLPKLASVLDMPADEVRQRALDPRIGPFNPRPIAVDVDKDAVIYLLEHSRDFPGVMALEIPVREYPHGALAAHTIGHIGQITAEELEARRADRELAYRPGDDLGKVGVERVYEAHLRGRAGLRKIAINARGEKVEELGYEPPERGWDAILTLDASLQRTSEEALEQGKQLARRLFSRESGERYKAPAGAVVALDPQSGEVLALASNPTFDPNMFVGPAPSEVLAEMNDPESHHPMLNRVIAAAFPPASTFKPFTIAAGWDAGLITPERTFFCPGYMYVGTHRFNDWTPQGHGTVNLRRSLVESCDIVYYTLGVEMNAARDRIGEHTQATARTFGFGSLTGIDLLGERGGLVPTADWKDERFSYARPYDRRWFPGDSANLAIGQGFLQATPLQVAVAYAALANGGTVYRPRVLKCLAKLDVSRPSAADDACSGANGVDVQVPDSAMPEVRGRVPVAPSALAYIMDSMVGVQVGDGTAAQAFRDFPLHQVSVSGKTGTAEMRPRQSFSWFVAVAPVEDPEIVVVALVEEGGTGGQIAAPIVRKVLEGHFGIPHGPFEPGARSD